jgi:hypothetical protein
MTEWQRQMREAEQKKEDVKRRQKEAEIRDEERIVRE